MTSAELDRKCREFAERQAAVGEVITALTEGRAQISEGAIVMEDMPHCLKALGKNEEDWMIQAVLDLLVRAGEIGVGTMQPAPTDEIDGSGMG